MRRRIEYDIDYMNNWSLWLDCKILLRTVLLVFWDHRAYSRCSVPWCSASSYCGRAGPQTFLTIRSYCSSSLARFAAVLSAITARREVALLYRR